MTAERDVKHLRVQPRQPRRSNRVYLFHSICGGKKKKKTESGFIFEEGIRQIAPRRKKPVEPNVKGKKKGPLMGLEEQLKSTLEKMAPLLPS